MLYINEWFDEVNPLDLSDNLQWLVCVIQHCFDHVQLKATGLLTTYLPPDHSMRAKLTVPEGMEAAVNVTV